MNLSEQDAGELIRLARKAIENYLVNSTTIKPDEATIRKYGEKAGVFVTLNSVTENPNEPQLRGCIGFPMPDHALYKAVVDAAISSATNDPRFDPITIAELNNIVLEISVLTPPELITVNDPREYRDRIKVGRDGLIIHWRYGSGLLLPQVPVEYNWDEERFLCETCTKAGATPDCWFYEDTSVYRFEAFVFKELEPGGRVVQVTLDVKKSKPDSFHAA